MAHSLRDPFFAPLEYQTNHEQSPNCDPFLGGPCFSSEPRCAARRASHMEHQAGLASCAVRPGDGGGPGQEPKSIQE